MTKAYQKKSFKKICQTIHKIWDHTLAKKKKKKRPGDNESIKMLDSTISK